MQRVLRGLSRLHVRPRFAGSIRNYSAEEPDVDKLLGSVLPKEDRQSLKNRLLAIQKDAYDEAMPSQMQEMLAETEDLLQDIHVKKDSKLPSRSYLRRETTKALVALKREIFHKALTDGLKEEDARKLADNVVAKAEQEFHLKQDSQLGKLQEEQAAGIQEEISIDKREQQLFNFAFEELEKIYAPESVQGGGQVVRICVEPSRTLPRVFGNTDSALKIFDVDKIRPSGGISFWARMEKRKTDITNLSMGPENAFDEMIEWTEQGKLWPYPINNEYLLGEEEKVHFTEHIFLDGYLSKHAHLPKTGPIAHFMELVLVGLSKNPYMTLRKKHEHLDAFAEFFNPDMIKKVQQMHADAQATAE